MRRGTLVCEYGARTIVSLSALAAAFGMQRPLRSPLFHTADLSFSFRLQSRDYRRWVVP